MDKKPAERLAINMTEAAAMIGVSVPIMREIANRKGFPAFRAGKRWIIPVEAFKAWLSSDAFKGE